jgi:hypothetical protein
LAAVVPWNLHPTMPGMQFHVPVIPRHSDIGPTAVLAHIQARHTMAAFPIPSRTNTLPPS